MEFTADLHIHSKYSRATSRDCDPEHLWLWAHKKGLHLIGTGDFTHPAWRAELQKKLEPAEEGLFKLKADYSRPLENRLPPSCASSPLRFMLTVEISTIYKKADRTRKVHHLILAPSFEAVDAMVRPLERIGNLHSDGRPILGLDSRHLLEIVLEADPAATLIPAHIWTPWFAVLGSKSGFDSIEECYEDLSEHIYAVETGLSSDPEINWRVSSLDRFRLVSHSDAHSPAKLAREATLFDTSLDYPALLKALRSGEGYVGTIEFFPEEGKYHLDGHRKCGVRLEPQETRANDEKCPTCGKKVTVGVMHRVESLADREGSEKPASAGQVHSLVPLPEILAEIHQVGAGSQRVAKSYERLLARVGSELEILRTLPLEQLKKESSLMAEAVARLRRGQVRREAGYDGEFGRIRLFEESELPGRQAVIGLFARGAKEETKKEEGRPSQPTAAQLSNVSKDGEHSQSTDSAAGNHSSASSEGQQTQLALSTSSEPSAGLQTLPTFSAPNKPSAASSRDERKSMGVAEGNSSESTPKDDTYSCFTGISSASSCSKSLETLDPEQRAAASVVVGPLMIVAGPGSGKTRVLTHRIAHLIEDHDADPEQLLAITFTRRAAEEILDRLQTLASPEAQQALKKSVHTFHSLGLSILQEWPLEAGIDPDFAVAEPVRLAAMVGEELELSEKKVKSLLSVISLAKRTRERPEPAEALALHERYESLLRSQKLVDFDDLILKTVELLEAHPEIAKSYTDRFHWVLIDEYQDIDGLQYALVRLLCPPGSNLNVIGDPDQAIYGFRGADNRFIQQFVEDYPGAVVRRLTRNYRSTRSIVEASAQVVAPTGSEQRSTAVNEENPFLISFKEAPTEKAEAEFLVHELEQLIGGHSFFSLDSGRSATFAEANYGFGDFAVLYRTEAQSEALDEALARSGMPYQRRSHTPLLEQAGVTELLEAMKREDEAKPLLGRLNDAARAMLLDDPGSFAAARDLLEPLAKRFGSDFAAFQLELTLATQMDTWDPRADRISLLTLHASKGLEFRVVFVVGCEDGLLPLRFGPREAAPLDEERRLFYVGMTRAKERLYLCRARKRRQWGKVKEQEPSPFLEDIEQRLLEVRKAEARKACKEDSEKDNGQLSLF